MRDPSFLMGHKSHLLTELAFQSLPDECEALLSDGSAGG